MSVRTDDSFISDLEDYSSIFLNLNALVIIHDLKGKILKVNKKFLNTLGYSDSDISSLTVKDLLPKESQKICRKVIDDTLNQGSASHEVTIKKKNQDAFPAYVYTSILEIDDTKLMQCVLHDITERKNIETKLYETNLFLDSIIENIPDMIFLKDAEELRFVRINKAGEELLGYSRKKLLGKNDYDFFPKKEADFFTAKDKAALKTDESINIPEEQIHTKAKGTRTLHTKKISIHDKEGNPKYLLGISEDITELKQAQERFELIVESNPSAIVMIGEDSIRTSHTTASR
ncbi:MAG: PAS domain-containing protein [Thermodesulfobacteriota bacterium]